MAEKYGTVWIHNEIAEASQEQAIGEAGAIVIGSNY